MLYISKNIICTDFLKVIQHFNDEEVHTISNSNSYDFYLYAADGVVYESKDPRILKFFGQNVHKSTKNEKKSFSTIQYNKSTELYTAKRYVLNVLHQEVTFDSDLAIVQYLNHNFPKKPKENVLCINFKYTDSTIEIERITPIHKKNEYSRKVIDIHSGTITLEKRKNEKNDWYQLSTSVFDLFDANSLLNHVPKFNIDKFSEGQIIL